MQNRSIIKAVILVAFVLALFSARSVSAQQRLSDKDVTNLMKNLKDDSKHFQSSFNSALSKSAVRKTSQEKIYKAAGKSFSDQVGAMLSVFQSKRTADTTLPGVLQTARQIDDVFLDVQLGGSARADWLKCKQGLTRLAAQFNLAYN
ncbi:MAG TPA: hypothetical protein VGD60_03025 [Candidatus Acidoferrales bacterium]